MGTRDPNSPGRNPSEDAGETAKPLGPQGSGDQPGKGDIRWIRGEWNQGERRLPENARIRRWMDLADQVLQSEESPIPPRHGELDKAGD